MVAPVDDRIEIWPDMAAAVTLFLALGSQWRVGMAGATGLDYAAVRPTAELLGVEITTPVFLDLRTMESEALRIWSSRK